MQLLEFFTELDQTRANPEADITTYSVDDTRKSKLTLEMINELRHTIQARRQEKCIKKCMVVQLLTRPLRPNHN